jgi:hypothetical protein
MKGKTLVGLDVHAAQTHAAVLDTLTGELRVKRRQERRHARHPSPRSLRDPTPSNRGHAALEDAGGARSGR